MTTRRTHTLPESWSADDHALYRQLRTQHVHDGRTEDESHERAVREVNEHRRGPGRAAAGPRPSVGAPVHNIGERSMDELRALARESGVRDPLALDRDELIRALADREARTRRG